MQEMDCCRLGYPFALALMAVVAGASLLKLTTVNWALMFLSSNTLGISVIATS